MSVSKTVIAHHPYEASRDDEISFEKDEVIKVTDDSDPDWWVGKKKDGSLGFFPSNFVKIQDSHEQEPPKETEDNVQDAPTAEPKEEKEEEQKKEEETKVDKVIGMARVMEDYAMQEPGEISLFRGGIINVYEIIDDTWAKGELNGKVGKYPIKCVEDIDMPGRPDLGRQPNAGATEKSTAHDEESAAPKGGFKLAAYGVKQGGIGSLLAGGFPGLKKTAPKEEKPKPAEEPVAHPVTGVPAVPAFTASQEELAKANQIKETQEPQAPEEEKPLGKAIVLHPYDADNEDELSLLRGEYVDILDRNADEGWWKGKNERGQVGVFPFNFVKELEQDMVAPPTPTRSRKSVTSATEARASPALAKPPQLPRPSSVQTPTARPVSVGQRPASVQTPSSAPFQMPTNPITQELDEKAIEEEEQYEADEEKPMTPANPETDSPAFTPSLAEHKLALPEQKVEEEQVKSPAVIQEDPISDDETKESGVDEAPFVPEVEKPHEDQKEEAALVEKEREATPAEEKKEMTPVEEKKEPVEEEKKEPAPVEEEEQNARPVEEEKKEVVPVKEVEKPVVVEGKEEEEEKPIVTEESVDLKQEEIATDEFKDASESIDTKPTEEQEVPVNNEQVAEEEKKADLNILPTGPKLTTPARARIGGARARRSPQANNEPSQMEQLQKELEATPEPEQQDIPEKPASPPPKPVKPIFAKFPTPFAVGAEEITKRQLRPTQARRLWEEQPAEEKPPATAATNNEEEPTRPTGVKNIASRFNFNGSGGGSNEVLETKLKNHTKNEIEKLRKEFEQQLQEEREKRLHLEELVQELLSKVKALE